MSLRQTYLALDRNLLSYLEAQSKFSVPKLPVCRRIFVANVAILLSILALEKIPILVRLALVIFALAIFGSISLILFCIGGILDFGLWILSRVS